MTFNQKIQRKLVQTILPLVRLYWKIFKPKTIGVKVIIEHDNKILCIKNAFHYERWSFPGGGIKRGKTPEVAAKREVLEEVAIALKELTYIGEVFSDAEGKRDTIHAFLARSGSEEYEIDNFEVVKAKWVDKSNLSHLGPIAQAILKMKEEQS